jgi:hypothetical protein
MMKNTEILIQSLDQEKLMRSLGARRRPTRLSAGLRQRLDYWQEKLPRLLAPRVAHRVVALNSSDADRLCLANGTRFGSTKLAKTLEDATALCCFVATIGRGIETAVNTCTAKNRYSDAFILDTLGSMAAEALIDGFHRDYERQCREQGKGVTLRFSPGYCDWDITDQIHLFSIFKEDRPADVQLTETCLMSPCKSVSGVFGILPVDSGSRLDKYNPCRSCSQPRCRARRI